MQPLSIDAATWQTLSRLIDEALELPEAARAAWLDTLPPEHAALRPHLEDMLRRMATNASTSLPSLSPLAVADAGPDLNPGDIIGTYRLVRPLGQGGMGAVWLAERSDGLINRPVALKLPYGSWQRTALVERMAREREILAALNHPHIARLYDAGVTAAGLPFLALEYVAGERIDHYCRRHALEVTARLRLFQQVTQAVAHAHARLVVHRDLKPSNILVTEEGDVRLLDFGIARLLEAGASDLTQVAGRVLTPQYASPEQLRGEPISVGSDVYSLGVVLCELLTGQRPYRLERETPTALEDAILRAEPAPPGTLAADAVVRHALRGDLDTIILKALKKSPDERYASVQAFTDDIERHLQGFPVQARPDSRAYRLGKFMRRHRVGVTAAAAVGLAIVAGAGVALWQARVAIAEKERAENVTAFISAIFREANPYHRDTASVTAADLLHRAKNEIDHIDPSRAELRVELLHLVGSSLLGLGDTASADGVAREAVAEASSRLGATHPLTVRARLLRVQVNRFRGETDEMRRDLEEITPLLHQRAVKQRDDLILALTMSGHLAIDEGRFDEAATAADEALRAAEAALGSEHPATAAAAMLFAEACLYGNKTPAEGLAAAERAHRMTLAAYRDFPRHPQAIEMREIYGRALAGAGDVPAGIAELEHAIRDSIEVLGPTHVNAGFTLGNLARFQRVIGDIRGALESNTRSLAVHALHAQKDSFTHAGALTARGMILLAARRPAEALEDLSTSAETLEKLFGPTNEETLIAQYGRALALGRLGRGDEAEAQLGSVLEAYRARYSDPVYKPHRPLGVLGIVRRLRGDLAGALAVQQDVLRQVEATGNSDWDRMPVLLELGLIHVELEQPAQAVPFLEEAIALFRRRQTMVTPDRADALVALGRARLQQGRPADALPHFDEAAAFWRDFDPDNAAASEATAWLEQLQAATSSVK